MNKILLTLSLILTSFAAFSQKKIEGFLGVKFGASKQEVTSIIKAKGGIPDTDDVEPGSLSFSKVKIGTKTAELLIVKFIEGKAFEAVFLFVPELDAKTIEFYDDLKKELNTVYGEGESYKHFQSPYEDGDGYEINAIELGKGDFNTFWKDKSTNPTTNMIGLSITPKLIVRLEYQDAVLIKLALDEQEKKLKNDF